MVATNAINTAHMDTVKRVTVYMAALNLNQMADMLYTSNYYRLEWMNREWCRIACGKSATLDIPGQRHRYPPPPPSLSLSVTPITPLNYTSRLFNSLSDQIVDRQ